MIMIDITQRIKEHNEIVKKKTLSVKEWAEIENISYAKALKLTHAKGFPIIKVGRDRRIIVAKLDEWLEKSIGIDI